MKNELDTKKLLRVFDKIRKHGESKKNEQKGTVHFLEGLTAYTDFDGYTVFIEDATVSLSFGFHNQYHFEYEDSSQLSNFEKKIDNIDERF
ncbi:DUF3081 family protein [Agaribacter flavus]|uniref:DUF3081 family protein n=1 Tax=Agaribacter flavus TaxID=1902781 RepID=A0ABV7FL56_9ALTE